MTQSVVDVAVARGVARVTLRRPRLGNALDAAMRRELRTALENVAARDSVRAVVICADGRLFCTGADLQEAAERLRSAVDPGILRRDVEAQMASEYRPIFAAIATMQKPVLAALQGSAAGAGAALALCCDLKVMAEDAQLLLPFAQVGLVTDCGSSWLLVRQLGYSRAYQLAAEGKGMSAAKALQWGLINRVGARADVQADAMAWAENIAAGASAAFAATKQAMRYALSHDLLDTFDFESALQARLAASADHREGVEAFLEKRPPDFGHR